nr:hypothetical protein BaRGS_027423 [Batillaria attramentaria]
MVSCSTPTSVDMAMFACDSGSQTVHYTQTFLARSYPDLRYLDASTSGMTLNDLSENGYLTFASLRNLRVLSLSANPLTSLTNSGADWSQENLRTVDLSLTKLDTYNGQVLIFTTVRKNSITKSNQDNQDATIARRLTTIVLSDFLCWFPIGLLGLLASTGTPISSEVNIGMAIFVLPCNSALNPFLYTFNVFMEKRRKAAEARLLQQLIRKAGTLAMDKDQAKRRAMTCSTQTQTDIVGIM